MMVARDVDRTAWGRCHIPEPPDENVMNKHDWLTVLLILLIAAALAGCSPPVPTCPTEELVAPALLAPDNEAVVNTLLPTLTWSYPANCSPEGYRIDLSPVADFSDTSLSGGTGDPSTAWSPGEELEDCTVYFWRVAGINGTTLGPFTGSRALAVDATGSCEPPTPVPEATASISGLVWHDLCALPDASISVPPEGCVAGETAGAFQANGVLEPGEPGLEGVQLSLGAGLCPSGGLATALTGPDGTYEFTGLAAGTYCLSANALVEPNVAVLIPGDWTAPAPGGGTGQVSAPVTVGEGEAVPDQNFGWDYQFLPAPPTPVPPTPSPTPAVGSIGGLIWNDVCQYTGGSGGEPLVLGEGCTGDPAGVWGANGVMDGDEEPMGRVTFRLGAGSCMAPAFYASTDSNSAGYFMFINLPAGVYCLSLNPLTDGNDSLLIPGGPSNWPTVGGVLLITIELDAGESRLDIGVGWEWQHLG
ncbi:MAG: hypothetical protein A2Z66_02090 [Chloroflexi bacterium RBG_13_66_10]|nr:MAG: hypothetical protein A2Z66_02090 [Chloroflexi bacterium RBG_13_66_10]